MHHVRCCFFQFSSLFIKKVRRIDLSNPDSSSIVSFQHVSMQFPGVLANDDVSLDIRKGEVFALVG